MRPRLRPLMLATLLALGVSAAVAKADVQLPNWPSLLPALPSSANVQPGPQPGCATPSIACIDGEITHMAQLRNQFACDHRAIFATTYLDLTRQIRKTIADDPHFVSDPGYLFYEDALFADYYFRWVSDYAAGKPVPPAWKIAFDTAASGDATAAQDLLLGINAHVQQDMPHVVATLGLRKPDGSSRKPDHDKENQILADGYEQIVGQLGAEYDPLVLTTNASWDPADNLAGLELAKTWREGVWRNAERLTAATTSDQRSQVEQSIALNAALFAQTVAGLPGLQGPPGYRAQRDAYCATHFKPETITAPPAASPRTGRRRARHRHHRFGHRRHRRPTNRRRTV